MKNERCVKMTVFMPREIHKALKLQAMEIGISMNEYIVCAIKEDLKEFGNELP